MSQQEVTGHPRRAHIYQHTDIGALVADAVATGMGSWRYIIIQSIIVVLWIALNSMAWFVWKWDLPPFILLNLIFSTQASYAAPIIMMSQNRQAERDRKRDDTEAFEVDQLVRNSEETKHLTEEVKRLSLQSLDILRQQNEVLDQQNAILDLLKGQDDSRKEQAETIKAMDMAFKNELVDLTGNVTRLLTIVENKRAKKAGAAE